MIELKQISKAYQHQGEMVTALQNINLTINKGDIFGVVGRSGAGKSTLLRCVNLLERPTQGEVVVDDVNLSLLSSKQLREQRRDIGMIFQHFNLLESATGFDNVALPLRLHHQQNIDARVHELLELVGITELAQRYPAQLSGGQKQRVAIARALATNPAVLLCDEATSALDPESTQNILQLLQKINRELDVTILLITHEMDVIKQVCHRVAVLEQGTLIEQGSVLDVFSNPQHEVTKVLTQKALHQELPQHVQEQLQAATQGAQPIVRLTFVGDDADEPIITNLSDKFSVHASILQANIENVQNSTIGFTLCQLSGEAEQLQQAFAYLNGLSIKVEEVGRV